MAKDKTPAYDSAELLLGGNTAKPKAVTKVTDKETEVTAQATKKTPYRQKRDKRLQVVITQDLYERLQAEKDATGAKSVNEIVNAILDSGLKKRG